MSTPRLIERSSWRFAIGCILGIVLTFFVAARAWCTIATDVTVSTNRSGSGSNITSPSFSTTSTNELLLAFIATDAKSSGITVTSVTGASLTWALVRRTNVQLGTAEIWRAFAPARLSRVTVRANLSQSVAASITVVSFTGIDTSGTNGSGAIGATGSGNANPGAPTASLITTRNNSWVFGVGADWDRATLRTLGANQTMVNQYLASVGDTYWVQRQNAPTAASGTNATINDTAPTNDRYNLTIVEVLPAPAAGSFNIFGSITPAVSGAGATVQLSGAASALATVDANGNYSFTGLGNGTYTVTPSKSGFTFSPTSQQVTISGLDQTVPAFNATAQTWTISGTISPSGSSVGTLVTLSGPNQLTLTTTPTATGYYSFTGLLNGSYTVTPSNSGYTFSPTSQTVAVNGANMPNINFTGQTQPPPPSGSDWLTHGHDPQRSGDAAGESVITTTSVKNLVLKWSASLDGKVTAQPLFVSATLVAGQTRDVVIAATAANSVYALDAGTGTQLWRKNFGPSSGSGVVPGGFGISATPAIDRNSGFIYTVSDDGQLHTLRLTDGTEATAAIPVVLDSINPPILSNTATNMVWGGLNLIGGNLYIATASDGNDTNPWWGRIVRVDVSGAAPVVAGWFKVVPSIAIPNGGGGIWGYGGASVDSSGRVFVATGADSNSPEGYTPYAGRMVALAYDLGYSPTSNPFGNPLGTYEPPVPSPCSGSPGVCDMDFGATPIIFQPSSCPAALTAAVKKDGHIYLLSTDDLAASATTSLQSLALNNAYDGPGAGGLTGEPAFWPTGNMLFVTDGGPGINGISAGVVGMTVNCGNPPNYLQVAWSVSLAAAIDQPPSPPSVANGVVFVGSGLNGSVHAYDATTGTELWNSGSAIPGGATFAAPMVASGSLYVASWNGFNTGDGGSVYAFAPGSAPPPPPPSSGVLLGDQTVESMVDSNILGQAEAFQTTASGSGTISTLSIYVDASSTATRMYAGIYADSTGHPGALIAQGSSSQLTAGTWNTIAIPGAIVSAGTSYWIAVLGTQSGTLRFRDANGGCNSETSSQTNLTALPAAWTTGTVYPSCPLSGYGSAAP